MATPLYLLSLTVLCTALLTGCTSSPDKRFANASGLSVTDPTPPMLDVTAVPSDPASATSVKDLPERAAAAYITALSAKSKTAAELQAALAKEISKPKTSIDNTVLARTLIITVSPSAFHLADRLTYIHVTIKPDDFVFTGISATATTWGSQPIDTLDITNNVQFQPELDLTLAGTLKGTAKGPLTASHQTDVKANTVEPFQQPTANLRGDQLVLTQTGARGIDLYGTTVVKLKLAPKPTVAGVEPTAESIFVASDLKLTDSHGNRLSAKEASINIVPAKGLVGEYYTATATLAYGIRHVLNGYQTYHEDDDDVQYIEQKINECIVLASPTDTNFSIWTVTDDQKGIVKIQTDEGRRELFFTSDDDAQQFATWLNGGPSPTIGARKLGLTESSNTSDFRPLQSNQKFKSVSSSIASQWSPPADSACAHVKTPLPRGGVVSDSVSIER